MKGFAAPNFVHGRDSKYIGHLSESRREQFSENLNSNELPSVLENLTLNDLHIQETLELMGNSTMLENWENLKDALKQAQKVVLEPDKLAASQKNTLTPKIAFEKINEILNTHSTDMEAWNKILELNERQRKLQETNAKIQLFNLEMSLKASKLVPVEYFQETLRILAEIFDIAPPEVRAEQLRALQKTVNAMPEAIKNR